MPQSVEKLSEIRSDLAEGALWDPEDNRFYWCDILGKAIHARDWETGSETSWTFPSTVGSFGLTTRRNVLVVALRDRVVLYDLEGAKILDTLAEIESNDDRTRTNDGKVGPGWRLLCRNNGRPPDTRTDRCPLPGDERWRSNAAPG